MFEAEEGFSKVCWLSNSMNFRLNRGMFDYSVNYQCSDGIGIGVAIPHAFWGIFRGFETFSIEIQ